ncbi:MAG: GNAT family N-acetyltransferase [Actinomycetota bacterium]|nr:GNAT family N-acetyltransferase [Actinomycetota bacterium]
MTPAARKATPADIPGMARALARAFYDDPVVEWIFPDERRRASVSERFFHIRVRALLAQQEGYTTDDHAGAACWAQPGRWEAPALEALVFGLRLLPLLRRRTPLVARGWGMIEAEHPHDPHYYLAILGTDPASQGQGVGSALLAPVLDDCDRNEIPAYLESSKESNLAFYGRHGFRVTGELVLPEGPPIWFMWRDPLV